MSLYLTSLLWPLITLGVFAVILIGFKYLANAGARSLVKRVLFDNRFRERHPVRFIVGWAVVIAVWLVGTALVFTFIEGKVDRTVSSPEHQQ